MFFPMFFLKTFDWTTNILIEISRKLSLPSIAVMLKWNGLNVRK